jgi:hypothetical protein
MESVHVTRVREGVEAFNRGDFEAFFGDLDPEVELHEWPAAGGGKAIRIELFTEREPALDAAGLAPDYEEEKR